MPILLYAAFLLIFMNYDIFHTIKIIYISTLFCFSFDKLKWFLLGNKIGKDFLNMIIERLGQ